MSVAFLQAQIIFQEDFEDGVMPAGWTIETNATDGGWRIGTAASLSSDAFGITPNGSTRIAGTNDDACNCNKSNEYFITPPIDLSDQTFAVLKADIFYTDNHYQGAQEDATIEASTDGVNWVVLEDLHGHGSWDTHSVNLSNYAGEDSLYIAFRYDDDGGWLYGFAIDNVTVEVPVPLDVALVEVNNQIYGEVNNAIPIKGTIQNNGATTINSFEVSYTIDGGNEVSELIENVDIPAFTYYYFETTSPWTPAEVGVFTVDINITSVNGVTDENQDNNSGAFDTEIFEQVIVPNKMDDFLAALPVITEVPVPSGNLNRPTDLDFFPILGKDELWVINQRTENAGGSTLTIADATTGPSGFQHKVDGNSWHFMSLPTGIAFSDDNYNFANSPGVQDANHNGGTFTGPALWSSDPAIYAQPSGGNGSHLDMLHGSPYSMGIAHEVDNVFWIYDDWNNDIVRYDFVNDHGPGNDDHSDGIVRRYKNIGIMADADIPNHMILDKTTGWLYFVDNGNDRVMRLDINSGGVTSTLPLINEPLAEHSRMGNFTTEVIIDAGLERPCGIEIMENRLLVGDYANGDIIVFDMDNGFEELGRIPTLETGLTGIKIGPDGNIWYTNRLENSVKVVEPGETTGINTIKKQVRIDVVPNPTNGMATINIPELNADVNGIIRLSDVTGKTLLTLENVNNSQELDLSNFSNGIYFLNFLGNSFSGTEKIILSK
ncbi:MAG: hypothetical protein DHS20C18_18700 [Saprospiraceae bacterium]|nr:MAG: hypothetical protein DHS20C18_18700 [Saprospiraceae bacterium]